MDGWGFILVDGGDSDGGGVGVSPAEVNLQDIIMERKTQRKLRAEEKRQLDLQRIMEMKSASGIDPLEQFPKEIWEEIFKSLSPFDRGNARQVHALFSNLMASSQIGDIFLPHALQLPTFHRCFEEPSEFANADYKFTKELRCISKTSRKYYDLYIDTLFERRMPLPDAYSYSYHNHTNLIFGKASDLELLSRLLNAFGSGSGKNPAKLFFPRGFTVHFSEDMMDIQLPEEEEDRLEFLEELHTKFQNDIKSVLSIIGPQIWHFRFFIDDKEMTLLSFAIIYTLFAELISLVPNLRWLEFSIGGHEDDDEEPKSWHQEIRKRMKLNHLRDNPFPHLASLEKVSFHYDLYHRDLSACPVEILGAVITSNPHVKYLDIVDGEDAEIQDMLNHPVKSLEHLKSFSLSHVLSPGYSLRIVETIVNFQWPLKTISLDLNMENTPMSSLFRFLERFPMLEIIQLFQLKRPQIRDTDTWGYLHLPNLKNLHLAVGSPQIDYNSNIQFFFSLQFLLHCGKLRFLSWMLYDFDDIKLRNKLKDREDEELGKWIDFRAGLRILHGSNIWDVFPDLQFFRVNLRTSGVERHVRFASFCAHEYHRPDSDQRKMSMEQFLKGHKCDGNNASRRTDENGRHRCLFQEE